MAAVLSRGDDPPDPPLLLLGGPIPPDPPWERPIPPDPLWKREDITGQRAPRQTVARPASRIRTAPATAAARQGAPARTTRPAPEMTIPCTAPPEDAPLVVEPPRGPSRALARAAASTVAVRTPAAAAAAAPAPRRASRTPTARLVT